MWFCVLEYPVTRISLCAFYPHPTGNIIDATNAFYSWILSTTKLVSQCRQTPKSVSPLTQPGYSTALIPILCHWTRSGANLGLFSQYPHTSTPPSDQWILLLPVLFSFLFILFRPLTFRLWCGTSTSQVFPSILLFFFQSLFQRSTWHIFQLVFIILILAFLRGVFLSFSCSKFSVVLQGVCLSVTYMAWETCRVFYPLQVTVCTPEKSPAILYIPSGCRLPRRWRPHDSCPASGHDKFNVVYLLSFSERVRLYRVFHDFRT